MPVDGAGLPSSGDIIDREPSVALELAPLQ
jgi:hypothetical protein